MDRSNDADNAIFVRILGMDLRCAKILVENEITSIEEIAYVPFSELVSIEGLQAQELQRWRQRAREYLQSRANDNGEDGEQQTDIVLNPPNPMTGGACAPIDENEKE